MTLSANSAYLMTQNATVVVASQTVLNEIALVEDRIANTTTFGIYSIVYNAVLVGNPPGDPNVDQSLTANQLNFRNTLHDAGYVIGQDPATGYWTISWAQQGPEQQVVVYEINTTVTPGPVQVQTVTLLNEFFALLNPTVTDRVLIAGSAISGTYVHLALVHQQTTLDQSSAILGALTSAGLGYSGGNTSVIQRT